MYAIIGLTYHFPNANFSNNELLLGFCGGVFDLVGSTFLGIAFSKGPCG